MNNIVFLDFDGVIDITTHSLKFDNKLLENVFVLCNLYRAKIVLSTSWRFYKTIKEYNKIFNSLIIDVTPNYFFIDNENELVLHNLYQRGLEIKQWLNENNLSIENCIIIDDIIQFLPEQIHRFVKVVKVLIMNV